MHVAEVALRVTDLARMVAWYQAMLGLTVVQAYPTYVFLKIADLHSPLGAVDHPQMLVLFDRQVPLDQKFTTLDHLAFEIPADQYDAQWQRLEALGCRLRQRTWPDTLNWRGRALFFDDPEGNIIEFIAGEPGRQP
jgi:catechol 2,3-dioxygenase-like lactoylglutathione lyase family enzyme